MGTALGPAPMHLFFTRLQQSGFDKRKYPLCFTVLFFAVTSLKRSPHWWHAHRPPPNTKLSNMIGRMPDKHLRQKVTNRRKYDTVRFIRKWFIQVRVSQLLDGLG